MDLSQFLARTCAPGGYTCISYTDPAKLNPATGEPRFNNQFFDESDIAGATRFITGYLLPRHCTVYHAQASFNVVTPTILKSGRKILTGLRKSINVRNLKSFWADIDISRPGDGKKAGACWASFAEVRDWTKQFLAATKLPMPNQIVRSGYGLHYYWVLEDAMPLAQWQPYADALRSALIKHGYRGEAGISSDAARVLRPPGTLNFKDRANPALVRVLPGSVYALIANNLMLQALQPFMGVQTHQRVSQQAGQQVGQSNVLSLAGGQAAAAFGGGQGLPNLNAAAQANVPKMFDDRPHLFQRIGVECLQAQQSLAAGGNGDSRMLWYLGFIATTERCEDGVFYAHEISKGDPRYTAAEVDRMLIQAKYEREHKGAGPLLCSSYDRFRPGICQACPHSGKIATPLMLGTQDGDLPPNYRRDHGHIEVRQLKEDKQGSVREEWVRVLAGDVHTPVLEETAAGWALSFTYHRAGRDFPVRADSIEMNNSDADLTKLFGKMTLPRGKSVLMGALVTSWIGKLRDYKLERDVSVSPFGWVKARNGKLRGFATGGTLYRHDGTTETAAGGDRDIVKAYRPTGALPEWQAAADFVMAGRVDLQPIIAASFAAPLMHFTGMPGVLLSAWSADSGVGKSSALKVGQTVWGSPSMRSAGADTYNHVARKTGEIRNLPAFWDELRVGERGTAEFVAHLFRLTEGKERGRLNSNSTLMAGTEWETMQIACSNRPLMDTIMKETEGTDAGALRAFEYEIRVAQMPADPQAAVILKKLDDNYGHAGAIYAAALASRHAAIEQSITQMRGDLTKHLNAETAERFYVAAIASMLVGAKLANKLGLTKFDWNGLKDFLCHEFHTARIYRKQNLLQQAGGFDLEAAFGAFVHDYGDGRLVTDRFSRQGKSQINVISHSPGLKKVVIHIAADLDVMRVHKSSIIEWCRRRQIASQMFLGQLKSVWGATETRTAIGGGTVWAVSGQWVVELPLATQGLRDFKIDPSSNTTVGATT